LLPTPIFRSFTLKIKCKVNTNRFHLLGIVLFLYSSIVFSQDSVDDKTLDLIHSYGIKGYENVFYFNDLDTAEFYLKKALELQYTTPNYPIDDRVASNHVSLASVYRKLFNYPKALHHLNEGEKILMAVDPQNPFLGYIYNNKGNILWQNKDLYQSKIYYEYALDWIERVGSKYSYDYMEIYTNYLNVLFEMSELDLAMKKLEEFEIEEIRLDPEVKFRFHISKGGILARIGLIEDAEKNFQEAKKILDTHEMQQDRIKTYNYYNSIIQLYVYNGYTKEAKKEIGDALLYLESLGQNTSHQKLNRSARIHYYHAYILYLEESYDAALNIINRVSSNLIKGFAEFDNIGYKSETIDLYTTVLPEFRILESRVFAAKYSRLGDIEDLKSSFESYKNSIEILNKTKINIGSEDSKIFATASVLEVYYEAIHAGILLYELTNNKEYLEQAFSVTESSKSFALYSEIKNVEAMEFSDVPSEVKEREQLLQGEKQFFEEQLYNERLSDNPDSAKIAQYEDKLFHLEDDYGSLMTEIANNYSQYFQLKYTPEFVTLDEIQDQLPHKNALIEYALMDSLLITYVVDKKGINVISQEVGPEFNEECFEYYGLMYTQNFSQGVKQNYERYVELGRKFYSILIEPCLQYTDRKNLTIVPDGPITYIPFEGLMTTDADDQYINYMTLPYLIREYSIGYSHSATLMFNERIKTKSPEEKVLAFAPKYRDHFNTSDTSVMRQILEQGDVLLPLGGVIKEVQSINETVPARVFLNEDATEANFKKHAADYNVLHLAMHTLMKDDNPMNSMLAFTNVENPEDTSGEDNRLYAYEIYNLRLNAQMAVLSSCSSGFGKMQKGEGMMSLARGFMYAGCPSIVMTLWQVSDKSSSEMMTTFYKYLKRGKSKQEAMRLSKIDYLDNADDLTSNPYFWSGFVVVGDNSPIYKKSGMTYYLSIILIFAGMLIFFQVRKK